MKFYDIFQAAALPRLFFIFKIQKNLEMEDKLMENHNSKYTLVVNKKRIPVTMEVYKAYYHCRDREKYLDRLAKKNNISLESCIEKGISAEYRVASVENDIVDIIIRQEMMEKLRSALEMLSEQERLLIYELFFKGKRSPYWLERWEYTNQMWVAGRYEYSQN